MKITLQIKKLAIIAFKRFFESSPYILIISKSFLDSSTLLKLKVLYCLKYFFKHSYSSPLFISDIPNLICIPFSKKNTFINFLTLYFKKYFSFKINNLYFTSLSLLDFNFLKNITIKKFLFQLKQIFYFFLKYIYSFQRYSNKN